MKKPKFKKTDKQRLWEILHGRKATCGDCQFLKFNGNPQSSLRWTAYGECKNDPERIKNNLLFYIQHLIKNTDKPRPRWHPKKKR